MKVGIIGPAGSGKTTLFNALTGMDAETAPSRKTNIAVVKVSDPRLEKLAEMAESKKTVPAEISFSDVAGALGKPSKDRGIEPKLLNLMQAEDAFAMAVADFDEYVGPDGSSSDPIAQARELESDLMLADLMVVESKLSRMVKENAKGIERDTIEKCNAHLEEELPLRTLDLNRDELAAISSYGFVSRKKGILVRNIGEDRMGTPVPADLDEFAVARQLRTMTITAKLQMEVAQVKPEERAEYIEAMGLDESALDKFIREAFNALDLVSFFTIAGPAREAHAWTIGRGSTALEAAGRVHTDIQRGFIRAEVVSYDDFASLGGEAGAKQAGKVRLEGKDYIVQDGDVIFFRFNV